jgi:nucleoside-diphosphate-sugar epimerase
VTKAAKAAKSAKASKATKATKPTKTKAARATKTTKTAAEATKATKASRAAEAGGTGAARPLTVAVTGPTGTFGFGLLPRLEADDRVGRVIGIARRPFDPREHGWSKMEYRRGDVRDRQVLEEAFAGADVVVHLAFLIAGTASREVTREINVDGTVNALRAAAAVGATRFVYASSVAAYGFHPDNPLGMDEDWPTRPAAHLFYAQEKAELEARIAEEAADLPGLDLYLLRPPVVVGPHTVGAKVDVPPVLSGLVGAAGRALAALPVGIPAPVPDLLLQLVHEDDVGQALQLCAVGAGPPGTYNIAGDGLLSATDVAREVGFAPLRIPRVVVEPVARGIAALPLPRAVPPVTEWAEAASRPAVMDTSRAKRDLGWQPRYTGRDALRAALGRGPDPSDG